MILLSIDIFNKNLWLFLPQSLHEWVGIVKWMKYSIFIINYEPIGNRTNGLLLLFIKHDNDILYFDNIISFYIY